MSCHCIMFKEDENEMSSPFYEIGLIELELGMVWG